MLTLIFQPVISVAFNLDNIIITQITSIKTNININSANIKYDHC